MIGEQVPVLEGIIVRLVQGRPGIDEETLLNYTIGTFHQETGKIMPHQDYETALDNLTPKGTVSGNDRLFQVPEKMNDKTLVRYYPTR